MKEFYVYMMTNRTRVVLYTGVTSKLEERVWEHKDHAMKGFTSKYKLDRLVYYEQFSGSHFGNHAGKGDQGLAAPEEK